MKEQTAVMILVALGAFNIPRAYAGTWSAPVYKVSSRVPDPPDDGKDYSHSPYGGGHTIVLGGVIDAGGPSTSGSVTATFTWQPDPNLASDPPPKFIYVAETASANWGFLGLATFSPRGRAGAGDGMSGAGALRLPSSGSGEFSLLNPGEKSQKPKFASGFSQFQSCGGSGTANNGLGSPSQVSPDGRSGYSRGTRLKKYDSGGGTVTTDAASPSASASSSDPSDNPETSWNYSAQITDFGIYRLGASGSKRESDANKDRDEWIGDDGVAHGHSRWSYTKRYWDSNDDLKDEPVVNTQHFTAFAGIGGANASTWVGVWSPTNPRFDVQPPQYDEAYHMEVIPDGGAIHQDQSEQYLGWTGWYEKPAGWYSVPSSGNSPTITYNLKSDATDITATYQLTLHDEWENPTDNIGYAWSDVVGGGSHSGEEQIGPFEYALPIGPTTYSVNSSAPPGSKEVQHPEWKVTWTAGQKISMSTSFGLGFSLGDWFNAKGEFESESSLEIKAEASSTAYVDLYPGDMAYPYVSYTIRRKHKLLDHFVNAGWDSNPSQPDGKYDQAADLPLRPQDIVPRWKVVPGGVNPD